MSSVDIIVPCYNEEAVLETFYRVTEEALSSMTGYQCAICPFPAISEKKLPCMPGLSIPPAILSS